MARASTEPDPRAALGARRAALGARLDAEGALFFAGGAAPRNYPANPHPFRASSHFLHLVGEGLEDAVLHVDGERSTLFVPEPDADAALWHGEPVPLGALGERLGLDVRPRASMAAWLGARVPASLLSFDVAIAARQRAELPARAFDEARASALRSILVDLRLRHDALAVAELRRAADATVRAHVAGMGITRPGLRASATRAVMEAVLTAHGTTPAYGSIVTPRGDVLHAGPTDARLGHDDHLLCDVGGETRAGYAADLTRTYPVNGRFGGLARELYLAVLRAQARAIERVRPGVRYRDLHLDAMRSLAESLVGIGLLRGGADARVADGSLALFFPHGLGHLLGLDVHDMEDLGDLAGYAPGRARSPEPGLRYLRLDRDLEPGMALTIEPGLYFVPALLDDPEVRRRHAEHVDFALVDRARTVRGIRIEDDVLVTDDAPLVLTEAAPKTLDALESLVGSGVDWDRALAAP